MYDPICSLIKWLNRLNGCHKVLVGVVLSLFPDIKVVGMLVAVQICIKWYAVDSTGFLVLFIL